MENEKDKIVIREDLKNGISIQIKRGNESKAFTLHTKKSIEEVRDELINCFNKPK